jgi:hypothetical protein
MPDDEPRPLAEAVNQEPWPGFPAGSLELYPAGRMAAAIAERDRLAAIVQVAASELWGWTPERIASVSYRLGRLGWDHPEAQGLTWELMSMINDLASARAFLAEAEPGDLKTPAEQCRLLGEALEAVRPLIVGILERPGDLEANRE